MSSDKLAYGVNVHSYLYNFLKTYTELDFHVETSYTNLTPHAGDVSLIIP